jgi:hypothetical protein
MASILSAFDPNPPLMESAMSAHVQAGSVIQDNDPRRGGRTAIVQRIEDRQVFSLDAGAVNSIQQFAVVRYGKKNQLINTKRIYALGTSKRAHGWTVTAI